MFFGGIVSVLAAFAGYIQSGGGEELLRRALANLKTGTAQFDSHKLSWQTGELVVTNLRHADFTWTKQNSKASFSGLQAAEMRVQMDLLPWPPNVKSVIVRGMHDTAIQVSEGFLQSGLVQDLRTADMPPIHFEDCDLSLKIGDLDPLVLRGCTGVLRRDQRDRQTLRGAFSLRELNNRPFGFKLETLEDGRWVLTGQKMEIDTVAALATQSNPFAGKLDPVGLLVRALFSGDMGAKGTLSALRIVVRPATETEAFACDGEVAYSNLQFHLPSPEKKEGEAVPYLLGLLLGADETKGENPWPRWMQVDRIKTGSHGRVAFHMSDGVLNFACDEGLGSAFTGIRKDHEFPPLEAFKGAVYTDAEGRPTRLVLRGFLGSQLCFETRIHRAADGKRTYELILEPRPGDSHAVVFGKPLWRFVSRVADKQGVAEFELEGDARHFPIKDLLPAGIQDFSGHVYAKGSYSAETKRLVFSRITLDDGAALLYGGPDARTEPSGGLAPFWKTLQALFATNSAWKLQDLAVQGEAEVQFDKDLRWRSTTLANWTVTSGSIIHAGLTTDIGLPGIQLKGEHKQESEAPFGTGVQLSAFVPGLWQLSLQSQWKAQDGKLGGTFVLQEKDIPLLLHPQRETLSSPYVSRDKLRVNRTTTLRLQSDGQFDFEVSPKP
jgi:hypothetical protein